MQLLIPTPLATFPPYDRPPSTTRSLWKEVTLDLGFPTQ